MSELIFYFSRHCLFATEESAFSSGQFSSCLASVPEKPLKQVNNTLFFGDEWHIIAAANFSDMGMVLGLVFEQLVAMITNKRRDCASELQFPSTDFC